jgi:alpha-L-arabinofuranosidase
LEFGAVHGFSLLSIDNASLMPANAVGGWRADVVKALRELKPGIIRFGGSTVEYPNFDWTALIGDPDHRKPFRAWGGLHSRCT